MDKNVQNTEHLKFDPGFSSCVARVSGNIEYIYDAFNSIVSLKQKKFQFAMIYPKIQKIINENVAFYLGCLLWASYLKSFKNVQIIDNPCLDTSFDDDSLSEINFLIEFVKSGLNRDAKYYLNKTYSINPLHIDILEKYREFLILNRGFISTKTTDDIQIPKGYKKLSQDKIKKIKEAVDKAVECEDILSLLPLAELVV